MELADAWQAKRDNPDEPGAKANMNCVDPDMEVDSVIDTTAGPGQGGVIKCGRPVEPEVGAPPPRHEPTPGFPP